MKFVSSFGRLGSILVTAIFLISTQACKTTADRNGYAGLAEEESRARLSPEQAIDITRRYCEKKRINLSGYYAPRAKLFQQRGRLYWIVSFEVKAEKPDDVFLAGTGVLGFTVTDATKDVKPNLIL
jgi:hypothetical protein